MVIDYDATDDSGWWEAKRSNGETGLIPSNYVEKSTPAPAAEGKKASDSATDATPFSVKALKKYAGKEKDALTFKKGAVIEVTQTNASADTYFGTCGKKIGWFPRGLVTKI